MVGHHNIHQTLLELGASVNLLLFTVYERLGLMELKPTKLAVQLPSFPLGVLEGWLRMC